MCSLVRTKNLVHQVVIAGLSICLYGLSAISLYAQNQNNVPSRSDTPNYSVQIVSLSAKENAETYAEELRRKGYEVSVAPFTTKNGTTVYRIRIGSFATEAEARQFGALFTEKEKKPCVVVKVHESIPTKIELRQPVSQITVTKADNATLEDLEDENELQEESVVPSLIPPPETSHQEVPVLTKSSPSENKVSEGGPIDAGSRSIIKIFAYRQSDGTLTITNNYFSIPEQLRKNIEYVSVYPVEFIRYDPSGSHILCSVDGDAKSIILAGVCLPSERHSALVADYFLRYLNKKPFRLRYNPWETTSDSKLIARLYTREGSLINLDFLKNGIGTFCPDSLPKKHHPVFKNAQEQARREKKGVWAND